MNISIEIVMLCCVHNKHAVGHVSAKKKCFLFHIPFTLEI